MERHQWLATGRDQPSARTGISRILVGALAIICAWSTAAFGASNMGDDCEHSGVAFLSPESRTDDLSISVVDLTDDKDKVVITAAPDANSDFGESAAPLLFLTPRVESIVDDVFESHDAETLELERTHNQDGAQMTPLAETVDDTTPVVDEPIDSVKPLDLRPFLPSIQRQMYRTDI